MIELLVVMAIMAMLGVAATGGYAQLQRGMRERAAVAGASALLVSAKERAAVDRVPTAVFCYNKLIREPDAANDENGVVVGVMTAIRRSGRLSYVRGKYLYDEFGDLELTYEALSDDKDFSTDGKSHSPSDLDQRAGMRLWKFPTSAEMKYSIVADAVWCDGSMTETIFSGGPNGSTNCLMSAFYNLNHSDREPTWKVGDAYGFEFAEIELPQGYLFSNASFDKSRLTDNFNAKLLRYDPQGGDDASSRINVSALRPNNNGVLDKVDIGSCEAPTENQDKQNQ